MKLAFTTLACPKWDLNTIITKAKEYGFDGIDFRGCAGEMDIWKLPAFSSDLAATALRIRAAGLEVPCMSSSGRLLVDKPEERAVCMDNVIQNARVGQALGATRIRVFGGHNRQRTYDEALKEAAATADAMARETARFDVTVLVETHDDWIASDKLAALLNATTEPNVGALWDIGNVFLKYGESPETSSANFGRRLQYTHIKDVRVAADGKHVPCLLGEGKVPVRDIIAALQRRGYTGWLTLEWEKKWHPTIEEPEIALPQYVHYIRDLLK